MKYETPSVIMPRARTSRLVVQDVGQEKLIYDTDTDKAISLNSTARFIWQKCDGNTTVTEMAELLKIELGIEETVNLVTLALSDLNNASLLEKGSFEEMPAITRRDLISQYGVPMAALPVVMALVAPAPAQMGSCIPDFQPCIPINVPCCSIGFTCQVSPGGPVCAD